MKIRRQTEKSDLGNLEERVGHPDRRARAKVKVRPGRELDPRNGRRERERTS